MDEYYSVDHLITDYVLALLIVRHVYSFIFVMIYIL